MQALHLLQNQPLELEIYGGLVADLSQAGGCNGIPLKGAEQLGHRSAQFLLYCTDGPLWAEGWNTVLQQGKLLHNDAAMSNFQQNSSSLSDI